MDLLPQAIQDTQDTSEKKLDFQTLSNSENLCTSLSKEELQDIGMKVCSRYDLDKASRSDWEKKSDEALKLALQVMETKTFPWPNAANIKFPLLTVASLQFSARVYPNLVKAPDLVKYRVVGDDPNGQKSARANRIGKYMSYQLLEQDEDWEEEQDKLFIALPILGCVFKKTYYDQVTQQVESCLTLPQDLVVHYYTKDLAVSPHTEVFELYPREIKERQLRGVYVDVDLGPRSNLDGEAPSVSDKRQGLMEPAPDEDTPRKIICQYGFLDLDKDNYAEPYAITVDYQTRKVLRIRSRFKEVISQESIKINQIQNKAFVLQQSIPSPQQMQQMQMQDRQQGTTKAEEVLNQVRTQIVPQLQQLEQMLQQLQAKAQQAPTIIKIVPKVYFTKYPFIPAPDGGYYDLGFGQLLGPINATVNTIINQLVDLGTLQSGNSGFIGKGARLKGGEMRFKPFEWKQIQVAGATLKESIVPLPVNQPSPTMFQLLSLLVQYAERIGSVSEIMQGENPGQNTPAYNMQAMLQQGLQVFNGVFKRIYRSFRSELRKVYELNSEYLDPMTYIETLDGSFQVLQNDFGGDPKDLIPAADPNAFSNMEAVMKAQFLATRSVAVAGYNTPVVEKRLLQAMDIPDVDEIYPLKPDGSLAIPPPPNPQLEIDRADMQRRTLEGKARAETDAARAHAEIELKIAQAQQIYHSMQQAGMEAGMKQMEMQIAQLESIRDSYIARADVNMKAMDVKMKQMDVIKSANDAEASQHKLEATKAQAQAKKQKASESTQKPT